MGWITIKDQMTITGQLRVSGHQHQAVHRAYNDGNISRSQRVREDSSSLFCNLSGTVSTLFHQHVPVGLVRFRLTRPAGAVGNQSCMYIIAPPLLARNVFKRWWMCLNGSLVSPGHRGCGATIGAPQNRSDRQHWHETTPAEPCGPNGMSSSRKAGNCGLG